MLFIWRFSSFLLIFQCLVCIGSKRLVYVKTIVFEMSTKKQSDIFFKLYCLALFTIEKRWTQSRCPSTMNG